MREHPILFSGRMIRAILEGRKTQTRRIIRVDPVPNRWDEQDGRWTPLGPDGRWAFYREGFDRTAPRWLPSIHMPRWASRLILDVTSIRIERLHEITEADAIAEGLYAGGDEVDRFRRLWDMINGKRAPWGSNPWVWVVGFEVHHAP